MKKQTMVILILIVLSIAGYLLTKKNLNFYQITCGTGDNEVQYIATKKQGQQYLVQGEYRSFEGCRIDLVEPK